MATVEKTCPNCTKSFSTSNSRKKYCTELCRLRASCKRHYRRDPEAHKDRHNSWLDANREDWNEYCRERYYDDLESSRQYCREYYLENKKKIATKQKRYYLKNREKLLQYHKEYYRKKKNG